MCVDIQPWPCGKTGPQEPQCWRGHGSRFPPEGRLPLQLDQCAGARGPCLPLQTLHSPWLPSCGFLRTTDVSWVGRCLVLLGLCLDTSAITDPGRCETSPYFLALFFYLLFYTLWSRWFHELIMNSLRCLLEIIFIDMVSLTKALFK